MSIRPLTHAAPLKPAHGLARARQRSVALRRKKKYFHGLERPFPGSPNFSVNTSYGVLSSRTPHVIRYKDVLKWLKIHRRTLDYYIQRGYLKRVYGGGERAIGVSRDSSLKFIARRSGR